jgi:2-polyprenyl-3-methyl-5-hydroxy-6-metoxy-1,4-benzoquinol methylase
VRAEMKLPLTYTDIVDEVVAFTSLSRDEVELRVWMQALQPGWNVQQDAKRFGITPHVSSREMDQLYKEGDGFIFETLVYWANPERYHCTEQALERIRLYADLRELPTESLSILIFGDGTGNDSLYLANQGLQVNYFDIPGSRTYEFALKRFDSYGYLGNSIRPVSDYQACFTGHYDVVLTFDVLEHLPEPLSVIQDISGILRTGGIALVTEDFGDIVAHLPTHLRANNRFLGRTPFLFLKAHMLLTWYNLEVLFKPMEFTKVSKARARSWLSLIADGYVRSAYLSRYSGMLARHIGKVPYFRFRQP